MRNLAVIAIIITALVLTSCGGSEPARNSSSAPVPSPPTSAVIDAKVIYKDTCAVCHGTNRQGTINIGPPLTPSNLARLSDAQIRDVILEGKANTAMTGFKGRLSSEQIDALIQLLRR